MYWTYDLISEKQYRCDLTKLEPFMLVKDANHVLYTQEDQEDDYNKVVNSIATITIADAPPPETDSSTELSVMEKCKLRLAIVHKCEDPLFWALFLAKHGQREYERIGKNNGNIEMKEKKEMAEQFQTTGATQLNSILKTKFTKSGSSILASDLLTKPKMYWKHLYIVCMYYECNIYLVDVEKNVYLTYLRENPEKYDTYVIYRNKGKGQPFWIDTSEQVMKLHDISNKFLWISSYEKPFKAASHYKVSDIQSMLHLVGLSYNSKMKKQELYELLAVHCAEEN
jgi:hypothetical protein